MTSNASSRRPSMRFSLLAILTVTTLFPLSVGGVATVDVLTGKVVYSFGIRDAADKITSQTRGLLGDRIFLRSAVTRLLTCLVMGCVVALMFFLRSKWLSAVALSLVLAIPPAFVLAFWPPTLSVNYGSAIFVGKLLLAPVISMLSLVVFFVFLMRRFGVKTKSSDKGRISNTLRAFRLVVAIAYLLSGAYGWHHIREFRSRWMEDVKKASTISVPPNKELAGQAR